MSTKKQQYKKRDISFFIGKLVQMLKDEKSQGIIEWTPFENGFEIKNVSLLTKLLLPQHYNHSNLSSFIRQLNIYGFKKDKNKNIYLNQHFTRESPENFTLLKKIKPPPTSQLKKAEKKQASTAIKIYLELIEENKHLKQSAEELNRIFEHETVGFQNMMKCCEKLEKLIGNEEGNIQVHKLVEEAAGVLNNQATAGVKEGKCE